MYIGKYKFRGAFALVFCLSVSAISDLFSGFSRYFLAPGFSAGAAWAGLAFQPAGGSFAQGYQGQAKATLPALTRGPYLQMGSQSAVTLRWRTNKAADSRIEVGTQYGAYTLAATDPRLTTEHEIRISGLQAGTRYFYRFGSADQVLQDGPENYFVTAPAAGNPEKVRIAVLGDCGRNINDVQANTLRAYRKYVGSNPADLLLLLGDNAYVDGTDAEYQSQFFDVYSNSILKNHVLFPTPGNHDYHTTSQASRSAPYYKVFTMPTRAESGGVASGTEAYYSYDWGDIHFISLDSYGTESPDNSRLYDTLGAQVVWVKKDLAANTKPWVIVYWHHPPYSMGSHNSDTETQMALIRENFVRILERNGVDLVLTGHSHNYERSYLLQNHYGPEASFNASRHAVSKSTGKYNGSANSAPYVTVNGKVNHGTVYVVSGSAGAVSKVQSQWPHNALPFSDNKGGMLYLEVEQNRLDAKYLRSDGVVWDQFTVMKDVNRKTTLALAEAGPVRLTASWVGTYRWSTGETTRSITVSPTSNSSYQVTDTEKYLTDRFILNLGASGTTAVEPDSLAQIQPGQPVLSWVFPTLVSRGNMITVQASEKETAVAYVTDMNGRLVYQTTVSGTIYLPTQSLSGGMYLIRLQGKDYLKTRKFIVRD
jgi:Calcineurin-like phosphoesterase